MSLLLALLVFTSAFTSSAFARPSTASSTNLGTANDYNVFVFQTGTLETGGSQIEGRLAVGGEAHTKNYSIASLVPTADAQVPYNVVFGGNGSTNGTTWSGTIYGSIISNGATTTIKTPDVRGSVYAIKALDLGGSTGTGGTVNGNAVYGTTFRKDSNVTVTGQTQQATSTLPFSFATAESDLRAISTRLKNLAATGTTTVQYGGITCTGTVAGLNVFNVSITSLNSCNNFTINVPSGATAVINITGTGSPAMQNFGITLNGTDAGKVLYHFPDATSVGFGTSGGIEVKGSVLAPNAAVNFGNGQIDGTLVCNSLTATGLFKHVPFTGNLTSSAPLVLSSLTVSPASVIGGQQTATGAVTLSGAAPAGGVVVTLSSNNASGKVPSGATYGLTGSVTVPAGNTSANFTIATSAVTMATPLTISASYGGVGKSAPLTVNPPPMPTVLSFAVSPASVVGGNTATATVTLSGAAPAVGAVVALTSSNTNAATLPASVTVSAGSTTGTATVTTTPVASSTNVTLTASYNSTFATATLTVTPPTLVSLSVSPASVKGGVANATGTVTLSGNAPTGGLTVTLSSSNTGAATVPTSVMVSAGSTTGTFTVTSKPVSSDSNVTISAVLAGVTKTAVLTVQAPALQSLSVAPTSVAGGQPATGTVTLDAPAPSGGLSVTLSSSSTKATLPTSVSVAANATSATFIVNTVPVATDTTATISGVLNGVTKTADLTITAPTLVSVSVDPTSVAGGIASTGTVTISSAAPAGGLAIALTSSDSHATVPTSVSVNAGATTATFTVSTTALAPGAMNVDATITGTLNAVSKTATLTIIAPPALPKAASLVINPKITDPGDATKTIGSVIGGNLATGTLTLSKVAPTGGTVVTLSSSLPAIANNPANPTSPWTVTVPQGQSSVDFPIATVPVVGDTKATITATANGGSASADLLVRAPAIASLTLDPISVPGGTGSTGTVTLDGNAPEGGLVVALQSSDTNTATVPTSVTVLAGTNSATFPVSTSVVMTDKDVIITGQTTTNSNYPAGTTRVTNQSATLLVTAPKTMIASLVIVPNPVTGGNNATVIATISPAATADLVLSITSSSDKATPEPATITIPAAATTGQTSIKTVPVASDTVAIITATLGTESATATLTVLAPTLESVSLNPSTVLGGKPTTGTVTLSGKAPSGGITVALTSSEPSKAKLPNPASITVPAGETSAVFIVPTVPVATQTIATITGTLHGASKTATLTIRPPSLLSVTVDPSSVKGGAGSTGTVTISGPAPEGGIVITIASDKASASVPGSHNVTVAAGAKTATFAIMTNSVTATEVATITGTLNGNSQSAKLTVLPSGVSTSGDLLLRLVITPKSILSGGTATGEVTLLSAATGQPLVVAAPDGATVTLTSDKPDSVVSGLPPQVIIPTGKSSTAFTLVGGTVTETTTATITATYSGATAVDTLTVSTEPCGGVGKPTPAELTFNPASVTGGVPTPLTGKVRLSAPAPTGGMLVRLFATDESVAIFPRYIWVRSGEDTATFSVTTKAVTASSAIGFTAEMHGASTTGTLTLVPGIEDGGSGGSGGIIDGPTLTPEAIARGFRMTTYLSGLPTEGPNVSGINIVRTGNGQVLFRPRAVTPNQPRLYSNTDYQTLYSSIQVLAMPGVSDGTSFIRSGGSIFSAGGQSRVVEWDENTWTPGRYVTQQYTGNADTLRSDSNYDMDIDPRTGEMLTDVYRIDLTSGNVNRYINQWYYLYGSWQNGPVGGGGLTANEDGTAIYYLSGDGWAIYDPLNYVEVAPGLLNNVILGRTGASRIGTGTIGGKGYYQEGGWFQNYGELWESDLATGNRVKLIAGGQAPKGLCYDDEGNLWVCFLDRIMRLYPPTGGYFGHRYPQAIYTRDDSTGPNHAALSLTAPSNLEGTVSTPATFDLSGVTGRVTGARALRTGVISAGVGAARLDAQVGVRSGLAPPVTAGDDPLLSWSDSAYSSLESGALPLSYNNEWELSSALQQEIQQTLQGGIGAYPLKLVTRVTGVCGDPQVTDVPNAGWPQRKNLLTLSVAPLGLPKVSPGRCLDLTLPRNTYIFSTAGATWEIYTGQTLVASSVAANGWDVEDDHTYYGGVHVTVPGNTVAGPYEVRFNGVNHGASNFLVTSTDSGTAPVLKPLHLSSNSIAGGTQTQLVVTLDKPAPAGGATVALSVSGSPVALTIPDRVMIAAGDTSGSVLLGSVSGAATFYIHASYNGYRVTRLDVDGGAEPPAGITLTSFTILPGMVTGGVSATGTIVLSSPAPEGGVRVALTETEPGLVPLPTTVLVPPGFNSVSFGVPTVAVTEAKSVIVSATYGGVTIPAPMMLLPQGEPPTVKITNPTDGDVFKVTAPATTADVPVTVEATSNTPNVAIAKVEVFADGNKIGEASNSGNGNNSFSMTWTGAHLGTHKLSARATDAQGRQASTGNVSILVTDKNVAPKPVITPVSGSYPGSFVAVTITDSLAGATIRYTIDGSDPKSSRTAQRYSGPFLVTQSGTTVKARAVKTGYEVSGQASESYTLMGGNGGGGNPGGLLSVKIVSPADGGTVTQPTLVSGTVTAPVVSGVTTAWELSVRSAGSNDSWQVLSSGTVVGGTDIPVEGRFDPTLRLNGLYNLRLIAVTSDGRYAEDIASIFVDGHLKIGSVALNYDDLAIPVAGIPLTIGRSYDSRDKSVGDFGNGWTLDIGNVRLEKSVPISTYWEERGEHSSFLTAYYFRQQKAHLIAVVFPGEVVYRFKAVYAPEQQLISPIDNLGIHWVPMDKNSAGCTLQYDNDLDNDITQNNVFVVPAAGGSFDYGDDWTPVYLQGYESLTFEPTTFRLTTPNGSVWRVDEKQGLLSVTDVNSNTLTLTKEGLTSSKGLGINFVRDDKGRITQITDPNGNKLQYQIDSNGNLAGFTDRSGNNMSYSYDLFHNLTSVTNRNGIVALTNTYNENERIVTSTDANNVTALYSHSIDDPDSNTIVETTTDARGVRTMTQLDRRGNPLSIRKDLNGQPVLVGQYVYGDPNNPDRPTRSTDALGHTTTTTYNESGQIANITGPKGVTLQTMAYDSQGRLLTTADAYNRIIETNHYDNRGKLIGSTDALGVSTYFSYNPDGTLATMTDAAGNTARNVYDSLGRPVACFNPVGAALMYTWDANGNILSKLSTSAEDATGLMGLSGSSLALSVAGTKKSANYRTTSAGLPPPPARVPAARVFTTYTYSPNGHMTDMTEETPQGNFKTHTNYVAVIDSGVNLQNVDEEMPQDVTDILGRGTHYKYDKLDHITETDFPDGTTAKAVYDSRGLKSKTQDRGGRQYEYTWDDWKRLTDEVVKDSNGNVIDYEHLDYDLNSHVIAQTDILGHVTRFNYDANGLLSAVIDPVGNVTEYTYDENLQPLQSRYGKNKPVTVTRDAANNMTDLELPDGNTYHWTYKRIDWLNVLHHYVPTSETTPKGVKTSFGWDDFGAMYALSHTSGATVQAIYDTRDRVVSLKDPIGREEMFTYDHQDNITQHRLPSGRTESFLYDKDSSLLSESDGRGTTEYHYYRDSRYLAGLVRFAPNQSIGDASVEYRYTTDGLMASVRRSNADPIFFKHDTAGRITNIDSSNGGIEYQYDLAGRLITTSGPHGNTSYTYDDADRLTIVTDSSSKKTYFTYDDSPQGLQTHQLIKIVRPNGVETTYGYDVDGRVQEIKHVHKDDQSNSGVPTNATLIASRRYSYDADGRVQSVTDEQNRMTQYLYNLEGFLINVSGPAGNEVAYTYDLLGNRLSKTINPGSANRQAYSYQYDENGQLTAEIQPDNSQVPYKYDGNGNVIQQGNKYFKWSPFDELIQVHQTGGNDYSIYYEYDAAGNRLESRDSRGITIDYLNDPLSGYGQVIEETDVSGGNRTAYYDNVGSMRLRGNGPGFNGSGGSAYFLSDGAGSTTTLTRADNGEVSASFEYDAFGMPQQVDGADLSTAFTGIGGEQFDANARLYYLRARYYDPDSGRFLSPDPAEAEANEYAYATNDPANLSDPSGLESLTSLGFGTTLGLLAQTALEGYKLYNNINAAVLFAQGDPKLQAWVLERSVDSISKSVIAANSGRGGQILGLISDAYDVAMTFKELVRTMIVALDPNAPPKEKIRAITRGMSCGISLVKDVANLATAGQAALIQTSGPDSGTDALEELEMVEAPSAQPAVELSEEETISNGISDQDLRLRESGTGSDEEGLSSSNTVEEGGGGCFVAGTRTYWQWTNGETPKENAKTATSGGSIEQMEKQWQVAQGKPVAQRRTLYAVSRNVKTGKTEWQRVLNVYKRQVKKVVYVSLKDKRSGKIVERIGVTLEHPLMTTGGWVEAGKLGIGTSIVPRAGPSLIIAKIEYRATNEVIGVYNFTVDGDHTYFVGSDDFGGVLCHNARRCADPDQNWVDHYAGLVHSNLDWEWGSEMEGVLGRTFSDTMKSKIRNAAKDQGLIPNIPVDGNGYADFTGHILHSKSLPQAKWHDRDGAQFTWLNNEIGGAVAGYTWHHHQTPGLMQLVPLGLHKAYSHNGGRSPWSLGMAQIG